MSPATGKHCADGIRSGSGRTWFSAASAPGRWARSTWDVRQPAGWSRSRRSGSSWPIPLLPYARALRDGTIQKNVFSESDLDYFRAAFRNPYSLTAAINYYRANLRSGFMARSGANTWIDRKISAPTLLIWGEQDFALGKELTYDMEKLFTGPFEIKYIPDSGHWVQQEKPDLVNQYVRDFLTGEAPHLRIDGREVRNP